MTNTSATGGYLVPSSTAPDQDSALEDILHDAIVGITGLSNTLVRPRWQVKPPSRPEASVDWVAFGINMETVDYDATFIHRPSEDGGAGTDRVLRHSTLELLVSFYGPNANKHATLLRDGLLINQNFEVLSSKGLAYLETGPITAAPEYINTQWVNRRDLIVRLRREVSRTYPIRNVLSAGGEIRRTDGEQSWNTEN